MAGGIPRCPNLCECVCVCVCISHNAYDSVFELSLLPNNNASGTFLHKSGWVRSVEWIFITEVPAGRWMGEYVALGKTFYSLIFKQVIVAAVPVASKLPSFIVFLERRLHYEYNYTMYYLCSIIIIGINNIAVMNNKYVRLQGQHLCLSSLTEKKTNVLYLLLQFT
jgi:hypothetical protein